MIPLPRPSLRMGDCQGCGRRHSGACYLSVSIAAEPVAEKDAVEQIERDRRAHAGGPVLLDGVLRPLR